MIKEEARRTLMALLIAYDNCEHGDYFYEYGNEVCEAVECLLSKSDMPVVHGRWMLEREPDGKPYCCHCSVCDPDYHYIGITVAYDYCPNCGAKMDLEVDDDG